MHIPHKPIVRAALVLTALCAAAVSADILVLRDGTRVEGTLVGVRGDSFEFERSGGGRRVDRYDRADVRRVEIDAASGERDDRREDRGGPGARDDRGGPGARDDRGGPGARDDRGDRTDRDRGDSGRSGYGRPSGLRERTVSVGANEAWSDTGVVVSSGQSVYFVAAGQITWGKDRRDDAGGEHNSPRNAGRPIPDRPGGALIGRIDNGDPFFIGNEQGAVRVRSGGRLRLGINDDYLLDNSGAFRITIYY